jgi:hypothetical protein
MNGSQLCSHCKRLEFEYQRTIGEINSVVGGRFNTVGEKLRELCRWQDVRDKAVKTLYEHKKIHSMGASDPRRAA